MSLLQPLVQFAGFTCEEGQDAAYLKQIGFTLLCAAAFAAFARYIRTRPGYATNIWLKVCFWAVVVTGVIMTGLVLVVGPFFYSSWGCEDLILNTGQ